MSQCLAHWSCRGEIVTMSASAEFVALVPAAKGGLIGKLKIEPSSAFKVYRGFDTKRKSHRGLD